MAKTYIDGRMIVNGNDSHTDVDNRRWLNSLLTYATAAEAIAGTATNLVITPATLTAALGTIGDLESVLLNGNNTGASSIVTADGQDIHAENGGGTLTLRDGANDIVGLTTDSGAYGEGWVYLDTTVAQLGYSNVSDFEVGADYASMNVTLGTTFTSLSKNGIIAAPYADQATIVKTIAIGDPSAAPVSFNCFGGGSAVSINSGDGSDLTIFNTATFGSVALGGVGITVKTNNTAYANQLALNANSSAFETLIDTATLTADRTAEFPDASGSVRLIRYIGITSPTVHTATNGEVVAVTTGGSDLVVNLPAANSGVQQITIKKVDVGAGKVNITPAGVDTIDGLALWPLNVQYNSATLVSNNSDGWYVIATV